MSKELPYFQFEPTEYLSGDITMCSLEAQGLYIQICCLYWQRNCKLGLSQAKRRFKEDDLIEELLDDNIIKLSEDQLVINFLDEQMTTITTKKKRLSDAGKKGAEMKKAKATLKPPLSQAERTLKQPDKIREDKIRGDKKRKDKNNSNTLSDKPTLSKTLKDSFLKNYLDTTGNEFYWSAKEATNLKKLISSLKFSIKEKKQDAATNEEVIASFDLILQNLPDWNKENAFSVSGIYSQYNSILNKIRNGKSKISEVSSLKSMFDEVDKMYPNG